MSKLSPLSKKDHDAIYRAITQLLNAVIKAAANQFKGDTIPLNAVVQVADEILLSVIRNIICGHFEAMTSMVDDTVKEAKKS